MRNRDAIYAVLLLLVVLGCRECIPPCEGGNCPPPPYSCSSCVKTAGEMTGDMSFSCGPEFTCTIPSRDHLGNEKYAQSAAEFSCRCKEHVIGFGSDSMYICSGGEPRPRFHVLTTGYKSGDSKCPSVIVGIHHGPAQVECFKNPNWKKNQTLTFCNGPTVYANEFTNEERSELDSHWTKQVYNADGTCKNERLVDPLEHDSKYYLLTHK